MWSRTTLSPSHIQGTTQKSIAQDTEVDMRCAAGARDLSAAKAPPPPSPPRPSVAALVAEAARAPTPAASIALLKQAHAEAPTPVVSDLATLLLIS